MQTLEKDSAAMRSLARSLRKTIPDELEGVIECVSEDSGENVSVTMKCKHVTRNYEGPWNEDLAKEAIKAFTPKTRAPRKPKNKHTNKVQKDNEVADNAG
tara:strand:- start:9121 stop:9420 length:300 start_codon:yes stop_codon:yes gene_type:complete